MEAHSITKRFEHYYLCEREWKSNTGGNLFSPSSVREFYLSQSFQLIIIINLLPPIFDNRQLHKNIKNEDLFPLSNCVSKPMILIILLVRIDTWREVKDIQTRDGRM